MIHARVLTGDCRDVMSTLEGNSVDAIVTDPPYGLSFMGKDWDHGVPGVPFWLEAMRVLKPGGHLLAFGGSRTYHRLVCAIEDAGFEIRDQIMWLYGSGFPKSKNLDGDWQGWGTALKPAHEPICVARKPLDGTVAANVLKWGTGAINVDGCRVGTESTVTVRNGNSGAHGRYGKDNRVFTRENPPGRWPANVIHDGSDEVLVGFPEAPGQIATAKTDGSWSDNAIYGAMKNVCRSSPQPRSETTKSAARFFYCAKASRKDRDEGLENITPTRVRTLEDNGSTLKTGSGNERTTARANTHPTVKPTDLMRHLCRLVTTPGGLVLDPFCGSGSTGKAAVLEGFRFLGIELSEEYAEIARARIAAVAKA